MKLNTDNLKENATRINSLQLDKSMQIDKTSSSDNEKQLLKGILERYAIEPYEQFCNDEEIILQGVNQIFIWLEKNGFLFVSDEEKEKIWKKVQGTIKKRKLFTHNNSKKYHPVIMCREVSILNLFEEMRESKVDLRSEILKAIEL